MEGLGVIFARGRTALAVGYDATLFEIIMPNAVVVKVKSMLAAYYMFRVMLILGPKKPDLKVESAPALLPFVRRARLSSLSPLRCANMIDYFISEVDQHIKRPDERSDDFRNRSLLATIEIWDEAVVLF